MSFASGFDIDPAVSGAAARLVACGCIDGRFKRENQIFASVSEDRTHHVIITLNSEGTCSDASCDCGEPLPCVHCLSILLEYSRNPELFPDWGIVRKELETMNADELRRVLSRAFSLYPALLSMLQPDSEDLASLRREIRRTFRMFTPGGGRPLTMDRVLGIFLTEALHFEETDRPEDAVKVMESLLDEVGRLFKSDPSSASRLPSLRQLHHEYLRLTPNPDHRRLTMIRMMGAVHELARAKAG